MWRTVFDGERPSAQRIAALWADAAMPESPAVSFFETATPGVWRAEGMYESQCEARSALDLLEDDERLFAGAGPVPEEDWVAMSLEGLKPVRAGRFVVYGSHDADALRPGDIGLRVEAGAAFGTGHHGTTRGCLLALDALARGRLGTTNRPRRVLDVGCGTGVLAMAAAKRFAIPVIATDVDPDSVQVAEANARANGVAPFIRHYTAPGTRHSEVRRGIPFDLVMANILMDPLIKLSAELTEIISPGGHLILSGLLDSQEDRVLAAYRPRGLTLEARRRLEGWSTLVLQRGS